ncbi:MAG: hypothetical protein WA393_05860, partial [Nitrososphaeraceae archaeon]
MLQPAEKDSRGGDIIYRQNNIVTNLRRILLCPFFGNNVGMNSSMSLRKVGAALFKCLDKKNTVDCDLVQEAVGERGETMKGLSQYDLLIIGGGPAGQGAAEFAAFAGRRTL